MNPQYYNNYIGEFQRHFSGIGPDSVNCNEYVNECVRSGDGNCQCNSTSVFIPCLWLSYMYILMSLQNYIAEVLMADYSIL